MTSPDGAGPEPEPIAPPPRPGADTFTIEGRAAPALFVVGWLATILGLGIVVIGVMSRAGGGAIALLVVGLVVLAIGLIAAAGSQGIERRARAVLPYQGPSPLLVFAAAIPVSLVAVIVVSLPLVALGVEVDSPIAIGRFLSVVVQTLVYVGLIRLLVVDTRALSWAEMGVRRPDRRALADLGSGALWALPVIVLTIPISVVLLQFFPVRPVSPLPPTGETTGFLLQFAAGAFFAPIGEELLFRGLATTAWVRGLGTRRGVVRAALVFALAHIITVTGTSSQEAFGLVIVGFATRVPVALALGWLFVRSGSIWMPLGLHMAFNGILLVIGELAPRVPQ